MTLTPTNPSTDVTIDNGSASFTGAWQTGSSSTDKFGTDYRFANSGTAATATYNANIANAGNYSVQVWYPQGSNRANNTPYTVNFSGGSLTYNVNQQGSGGVWVALGTHYFAAGGGQVVISASGAGPVIVVADAVRFTFLNSITPSTVTLNGIGSEDGHVLESSESSGAGGTVSATASSFRVGDASNRRQYRGVVSFDTAGIPEGATIQKVTLKLTRAGLSGTPWSTMGSCRGDIRTGSFGSASSLAASDFSALPTAASVATIPQPSGNNITVLAPLSSAGVFAVNKAGRTQFRIAFSADDDNDSISDYVEFYSGDYTANTARTPKLEIQYTQ